MTEKYNIPEPNSLDSVEGSVNIDIDHTGTIEIDNKKKKIEEAKEKLEANLCGIRGTNFSKARYLASEIGFDDLEISGINKCNILLQAEALLDAAMMVEKSIRERNIICEKTSGKNAIFFGEDFFSEVIGHEIPYAMNTGEKDYPYNEIENVFDRVREDYNHGTDLSPDKLLGMCVFVIQSLGNLITKPGAIEEYFRLLDKYKISREMAVRRNIFYGIMDQLPSRIIRIQHDGSVDKNSMTGIDKSFFDILSTNWSDLPFEDFIGLMKQLDKLITTYFVDNELREGKRNYSYSSYRLDKFLYSDKTLAAVMENRNSEGL